jgi:MFS transporter, SP family, solute carrier family 2 (myo-inositol transporter), member 13
MPDRPAAAFPGLSLGVNRSAGFRSSGKSSEGDRKRRRYSQYLLVVAGLGGLLYGIDLGIIGGALPYLEATSGLTAEQLSAVVAAVLLGGVFSTLFAGLLSDWFGRRPLMIVSGLAFSLSIPVIALSHGFDFLIAGRILQGMSGGIIGVVVPLYLAECLPATNRGRGTGLFQWFLTLGIVISALAGIYFSLRLDEAARTASAVTIFLLKNQAWRRIFWTSLPGGILFFIGSCFVTESPRWLYRKGLRERAYAALLRSRRPEEAQLEFGEMAIALAPAPTTRARFTESLLRRKYVVPFLLSCAILFCNTATGVNSITAYDTSLLVQCGLSDIGSHWAYVLFTLVKFMLTMVGVMLVDRKGRKFLLVLGTGGMLLSLAAITILFLRTEDTHLDCSKALQALVAPDQSLDLRFNSATAAEFLRESGNSGRGVPADHASLVIVYSYGGFTAATPVVRSDGAAAPIRIRRSNCVPSNEVEAFFDNPLASLRQARSAPLKIQRAVLAPLPHPVFGWMIELLLYIFIGFYSLGPGVCVWLALSEFMPTRIRSNGMSIALVINQIVSTTMAGIFLPVVSRHGYSTIFLLFGGFTAVYFLINVFLLPETRGKTLEEIEQLFDSPLHPRASS